MIHLINRASGIPNQPHNGAVDEIPPVGPITITVRRPTPPRSVRLAFEKGGIDLDVCRQAPRHVAHYRAVRIYSRGGGNRVAHHPACQALFRELNTYKNRTFASRWANNGTGSNFSSSDLKL